MEDGKPEPETTPAAVLFTGSYPKKGNLPKIRTPPGLVFGILSR